MIKVLHVLETLGVGGLETVATNYFKYIDREKYHFTFLVFENTEDGYEEDIIKLGGDILKLPQKNSMNLVNNVKYVLNNNGPFDIVHSHLYFTSGQVMKAAYEENIPIRIAHSHTAKPISNIFKKIYYFKMRKYLRKYATDFIACSSKAGNHLFGEEFFKKNGNIIKNSVDPDTLRFDKQARKKIRQYHKLENKIVLGHVGTLNDVKNQGFLIDILSELNQNYILMLVGDGPNKKKLIQKAKTLNVIDKVLFIGNTSYVHTYLSAMDIFLFPSLFEGLGLALVEAQATNLPSITSDRIPPEAMINKLVKSIQLDEKLWIEAITNYETIKENRNILNTNIQKEGYDVESMIKNLKEIYNLL